MFTRHLNSLSLRAMSRVPCSKRWMSAGTLHSDAGKKVTLKQLTKLRSENIPIAMMTAYDYGTAQHCQAAGVDICLVGDSLAQVCLGYDSTTRITMDEMVHHCKAVSRGAESPLLVADMPYGSYHTSIPDAIRNAVRFVQEAGMDTVKLEGGVEIVPIVSALTSLGIPVMAHVGLLPSRHAALSGYRVQGKDPDSAQRIVHAAEALQNAGAYSIVLEAIPHQLGTYITNRLYIPTLGIGAGSGCSGQVLVWDDAFGAWAGHQAKFVRRFADLGTEAREGMRKYVMNVRDRRFPDQEKGEGYAMADQDWQAFLSLEGHVEGESPKKVTEVA